MRPIGDNKNWMLLEPMVYRVLSSPDSIVVPAGFITDFASIPPEVQSFLQELDRPLRPAVIHDYLYWTRTCTRQQADNLLQLAMTEMHVESSTVDKYRVALAAAGGTGWFEDALERSQGLPRVVPFSMRRARPNESWTEYRLAVKDAMPQLSNDNHLSWQSDSSAVWQQKDNESFPEPLVRKTSYFCAMGDA
jgi:hypothetical protein